MSPQQTEVWQRGAIAGFELLLMPVVHALVQVREDLDRLAAEVPDDEVWIRPGGAASIGFHIRHLGGALDRLFTYARGEELSEAQRDVLRGEGAAGDPPAALAALAAGAKQHVDRALDQLRTTPRETLLEPRFVGRARLPSTVLGLLFHAAEHSTRHVGQAITTARILRGADVQNRQ